MLSQHLYSYKDTLDKEGVVFTFCGPISHDIVEGVGITLKSHMKKDNVSRTTIMKVFSIFIEQVQNVINYSYDRERAFDSKGIGIMVVGKRDGKHFIIGGNKIQTSKVSQLEDNLKKLSLMNKDELKTFYKEKRKANEDKESKGAGIGFIEMAKKTSQPLEYYFEKIDDKYSFFSIKANV